MARSRLDAAQRALSREIARIGAENGPRGARIFTRTGATVLPDGTRDRMTCLMLEAPGTRGLRGRELAIARRNAIPLICQPGQMDRATLLRRSAQELLDLGFGG